MNYTQAIIRDGFWNAHPQFESERRSRKRQNDYRTDIRVSFVDYVDSLRRDGEISEALASRVTL
jgi:hypothetical protein